MAGPRDIEIEIDVDADIESMRTQLERLLGDSYNNRAADVTTEITSRLTGSDDQAVQLQWVAILDGDTCEECEDNDGEVYDAEDTDGLLPLHPNCRCAWSPVIDDQSLADITENLE